MMRQSLLTDSERNRFAELGYLGPVTIFEPGMCRRLTALMKREFTAPAEWPKGKAVTSRLHYEVACAPAILGRVAGLLDGPVMLWGSSLVLRLPGQAHGWHTDIETHHHGEAAVSVWVALEGTDHSHGLSLIERSHRLNCSLQEAAHQNRAGIRRPDSQTALTWAQALQSDCALVRPPINDGQAIFFDGRLWHGSANSNRWLPRRALLLQYARPGTAIRAPDPNHLQWPVKTIEHPRPPCIMVLGSGTPDMNRLVAPPSISPDSSLSRLTSVIRPIPDPMTEDRASGWRSHHLFAGQTPQVDVQHCHVSVLSAGATPHPPHQHVEEEVLVMLSGETELSIVSDADSSARTERLQAGDLVYYPHTGARHTLSNRSARPATYLMFKWRGAHPAGTPTALAVGVYSAGNALLQAGQREASFATAPLFEAPTHYLSQLHAHVSIARPGGGYQPHVDAHDVAILLFEGEIETLDERVSAPAVVYISAGELHGLSNPGQGNAKYLVLEFHGRQNRFVSLPGLRDIKGWLKRSARPLLARSALAEGIARRLVSMLRRH